MDLLVLVALVVLAIPVISIVALVQSNGLRRSVFELESRLTAVERSFSSLERRLSSAHEVTTPTTTVSETPLAPAPAEPATPPAVEQTPAIEPTSTIDPRPATASVEPAPATPPAASTPPSLGFEERFGTRWVVWVGGVAVALGGIFLVRYTIQQGLIGPAVRVALGALLALVLIAVGEWTRRAENLSGLPGLPTAHIPGILTAAGTVVAYATVYAAYDLYGFLPPALAFVLLGLVALLTLAAALLHGPALAGLGVLGAFGAPALVSTTAPNYWALYIYVAVVTAAAFTLARIRLWRWLALTAVALGALWTVEGTDLYQVAALGAHTFNALAGFALAAMLLVCGLLFGPPAAPGEIDAVSSVALAVYLLVAALLTLTSHHDTVAFTGFVVLTIGAVAIAWQTDAAVAAVPVAAVLAAVVMADWAAQINLSKLVAPSGIIAPAIPEPSRYDYSSHLVLAAGWTVMFGGAGYLAQGRSVRALVGALWSASGVFAALAILVALYYRLAALDASLPFAALALLLAAAFGLATETLVRAPRRPGLATSSALFATGALAALALAFTFALEKGWLTIALALMVPGAAWIAEKRPLPWLRWLAAIMVGVVTARIAYEPRIVGSDLGTTPILNWLLYGYGVPALSFWVGGWLLRRRADDLPTRIVDSGAILFTVLLVIFEIRHYVTGGDIYAPVNRITEAAIDVNAGLALTIGLERVRERTASIVHNAGALIVAALTLATIVFDLVNVFSSRFMTEPVGGAFFNMILVGYGLPAVLAIILAMTARTTRPLPYRVVAAVTAVTLALFYITLQIRWLFHGPILAGPTSDAEQYGYSSAWLVFAIALLAVGFALRSQPARLLALGVIALTIAKVFIVDTASITGIYRALSVIGLGIVLLGIGWLYQRLLYPRLPVAEPAAVD